MQKTLYKKKVSIITPAYNAQNTIRRAVDSALNQKFPKNDLEIIIVNDGSTDDTLKILKTYGKRIIIINQNNQGPVKAANRGFGLARGKYIIKIDADDYFKPNILKEMVAILDKKSEIDFVFCDYYEKSPERKIKIISTKNIFNVVACGIMFRKKNIEKEGFYNEKIKFAEYDLLLKKKDKWSGYRIAKPLFYYDRSGDNITGNKKWVKEAKDQLIKIYPERIKEIKKIRKY